MRAIVAGGGVVGVQVAAALRAGGDRVVVVETEEELVGRLRAGGIEVVPGNACVAETLELAGGLAADVLVACTASDQENLLISIVAKRRLEIPRVVARINDEANLWLFDESWGVDAAISAASALLGLIREGTDGGSRAERR